MQLQQPQTWKPAPDVQTVANDLINQFHSHLATPEIRYLFFTKEIMQGEKQLWGRARKVSGLNAALANHDTDGDTLEDKHFFVIEVWEFIWHAISDKQKRALVDHELEHCWADENGRLSLLKHDVEEFTNVIRRHGLWRADVQAFFDAANSKGQSSLFDEPAPKRAPEPAYEGEPAYQNVFPMPTRPTPLQLASMPANLLGNGSTALPGTEPRQLSNGSTEPAYTVRCPECKEYSLTPASEINAWANEEVDLECLNCHHKFGFDEALYTPPTSNQPDTYGDAIDAEFTDVEFIDVEECDDEDAIAA